MSTADRRRCSHWVHSDNSPVTVRCTNDATHMLYVNGQLAHGPYVCQEHGEAVIAEYSRIPDAVGVWTLEPIA